MKKYLVFLILTIIAFGCKKEHDLKIEKEITTEVAKLFSKIPKEHSHIKFVNQIKESIEYRKL